MPTNPTTLKMLIKESWNKLDPDFPNETIIDNKEFEKALRTVAEATLEATRVGEDRNRCCLPGADCGDHGRIAGWNASNSSRKEKEEEWLKK